MAWHNTLGMCLERKWVSRNRDARWHSGWKESGSTWHWPKDALCRSVCFHHKSHCTNKCTCFLMRDLTDTGQEKHGQSDDASPDEWQKVDTAAYKRSVGVTVEHSKDGVVMELLQMYSAQHDNFSQHYADRSSLKRFLPRVRLDYNTAHLMSVFSTFFSFARRCVWVSDDSFSLWYLWTGAAGSPSRWSHRPLWSTRGAGGGSDWTCSEARWSPAGTEKVKVPTRPAEAARLQMQRAGYWATPGNYLCQTGTDQSQTST